MTQSTENFKNGVGDHASYCAAIARWDDEGGAPKSLSGSMSTENAVPFASWFIPPIMVPAFFMGLIIASVCISNPGNSRMATR